MAWFNENGKENNKIISTRIRLARNLKEFPFPGKMNEEDRMKVLKQCRKLFEDNEWLSQQFLWLDMDNTPALQRQKLVEKHLVSPDMIQNPKGRAIIISQDETICIMLNEEDHIRIQVILAGMELEKGLQIANQVDDILSQGLNIAFSSKYGYLTSCPTNLGTGLRASVMMHLPALVESGHIDQLLAAIGRMGIAVRGLYGEGSKAVGNLFQVSNQVTLGLSEDEIVKRLHEIIQNIASKEQEIRKQMMITRMDVLKDRVWRAYGMMQYAYMLSSEELLSLISDVRLGADLGILQVKEKDLNNLLVETSPAHVADLCGSENNAQQRDIKRAELVRKFKIRGEKNDVQ